MNLLGKIFVVALCLLSVIFMTLAMVVYSTHRDWKAEADKARAQVSQEQAKFSRLQTQSNALQSSLTAERDSYKQQVAKLESEARRLAEINAQIQGRLDELSQSERQRIAAVTATTNAANQLADEVGQLRDSISENIAAKDKSFDTAIAATEELQSIRNDLASALEYNRQLVTDNGRMTRLMEAGGLDPNAPADGVTPRVDGFVSQTQRRNGVMLVEISIGEDDGLRVGDTVEVFRNTKYKGRLEILKTAPDRSVGKVDTRFQQGPIQEGDRVATRLNLGR